MQRIETGSSEQIIYSWYSPEGNVDEMAGVASRWAGRQQSRTALEILYGTP